MRTYGFEVVVSARVVVEAADGLAARQAVERMLDGVSAELTSGASVGLDLRDIGVAPESLILSTSDGADSTAAPRAMLDGTGRGT